MSWVKYGSLLLLALLIESNLSRFYELGIHTPDLLLILLIFISIKEGKIRGTLTGFSVGLIQDLIVTVGFLGLSSFSKSITAFVMGYFSESRRSRIFPGILIPTIIGIFINNIIVTMFRSAGSSEGILSAFVTKAIPSSIYSFVIAFTVFIVFKPADDST